MGAIENPNLNIGQILEYSFRGEPVVSNTGGFSASDFESSLNAQNLTLENQVEYTPPNPSSLFPLINQRITDAGDAVNLSDASQIENLVNSSSFQIHISEQTRMVETLRTFDTFGGAPMSPVPFEEFEAISAITNTDQGPVVASILWHPGMRIAYLYNQNDTYDSAYIQFPEGSEPGFAKQTIVGEGGLVFSRIVPIIKFDNAPTEVITTDYMDALEGDTTNPPTYPQNSIEGLEEITTTVRTQITQPESNVPNTFSVEIQPTEEVASTDQLVTFDQPKVETETNEWEGIGFAKPKRGVKEMEPGIYNSYREDTVWVTGNVERVFQSDDLIPEFPGMWFAEINAGDYTVYMTIDMETQKYTAVKFGIGGEYLSLPEADREDFQQMPKENFIALLQANPGLPILVEYPELFNQELLDQAESGVTKCNEKCERTLRMIQATNTLGSVNKIRNGEKLDSSKPIVLLDWKIYIPQP